MTNDNTTFAYVLAIINLINYNNWFYPTITATRLTKFKYKNKGYRHSYLIKLIIQSTLNLK